MNLSHWRRSIGLGDALILLFIVAFVRQYFWIIQNNRVAWILTAIASLAVWGLCLQLKRAEEQRTPAVFWLIVALPLLLFYLLRLPFPDISFDVLNYRLVQSERALRGAPFINGDFAPVIFPLNPAPDLVTGIPRHVFGYRIGTVINYSVLLWLGVIVNKFLEGVIRNKVLRCLAILLVLLSEHILFQVNTYMVDLLALPLLAQACWLTFTYRDSTNKPRDLILVSLLLGGALALKLSNVTAVVPIASWLVVQVFAGPNRFSRTNLSIALLSGFVFFLPMLPHAIYIYRDTGSPFFPLYNEVFQSPYWSNLNVGDGRWGPIGAIQTIAWPLASLRYPERLSELGLYSGKLTIGVLGAIVGLVMPRSSRQMRGLALVVLSGSLLWSAASGYIRYALIFEVLGIILIFYLIFQVGKFFNNQTNRFKAVLLAIPLCLITVQSIVAVRFAYRTEWSLRPTFFDNPSIYLHETKYFFHDHNLSKFLAPDKKPLVWAVESWLISAVKSSGLQVLLRNDVPMIGIHNSEYFLTPKSIERFRQALKANKGKRLFTLIPAEQPDSSNENMRALGFDPGPAVPLTIRVYSDHQVFSMSLVEVSTLKPPPKPVETVKTTTSEPLKMLAFNAQLQGSEISERMRQGTKATITVRVTNSSDFWWPSVGQSDGRFYINVANSWYDLDDEVVTNLDGRSNIPFDLWPGDSCDVPLQITAPTKPGEYILELDLVQEGVAFFKGRGSSVFRTKVIVY